MILAGGFAFFDALRSAATVNTELQGPSGIALAVVGAIWLVARVRERRRRR
jgi:hypothetical protein